MGLDTLLARLEGRAVTSVTADVTPDVTPKPAPMLASTPFAPVKACTPVTPVTAENDDTAGKATGEPLPDPAMEGRRRRVLAMLAANPSARYALLTDLESDAEAAIVALGIRGQATCELRIPKAKYDGVLLLDLIERYGTTVH